MLKAIEGVLQDLKLQAGQRPLRYCISISTGNTVSVSVYGDARRFYQVKVSEIVAFDDEFRAHKRAWKQYGDLVPQPIGRQMRDGWDVFVTQGVHHKPFIFNNKGRGLAFESMLDDLSHFFQVSANAGECMDDTSTHQIFLGVLEQHFKPSPLSSLAAHWIEKGRSLGICGLPVIAQHGDFVVNNLAYSGKQLVVFDWEDFGKFHLPGLDICSFCFSVAPSVQDLRAIMTSTSIPNTALGNFVHRACSASAIDKDLFRRLIPLYLLGFLYAKREYSAAVQSRISAAVTQLSAPIGY